jgi:hypothetical protein
MTDALDEKTMVRFMQALGLKQVPDREAAGRDGALCVGAIACRLEMTQSSVRNISGFSKRLESSAREDGQARSLPG